MGVCLNYCWFNVIGNSVFSEISFFGNLHTAGTINDTSSGLKRLIKFPNFQEFSIKNTKNVKFMIMQPTLKLIYFNCIDEKGMGECGYRWTIYFTPTTSYPEELHCEMDNNLMFIKEELDLHYIETLFYINFHSNHHCEINCLSYFKDQLWRVFLVQLALYDALLN